MSLFSSVSASEKWSTFRTCAWSMKTLFKMTAASLRASKPEDRLYIPTHVISLFSFDLPSLQVQQSCPQTGRRARGTLGHETARGLAASAFIYYHPTHDGHIS